MDSRIKSAIARLAHARPARVASVGIAVLIAIALGTVTLPAQQAQQPQVSDMSLAQGFAGRKFFADDIPQAR